MLDLTGRVRRGDDSGRTEAWLGVLRPFAALRPGLGGATSRGRTTQGSPRCRRAPLLVLLAIVLSAAPRPVAAASFEGLDVLIASGISANGAVVVGQGTGFSTQEAFRWTRAGGLDRLGDLPGGLVSSGANAASSDGSVVVGSSSSAGSTASGAEAFRWTPSGGMVGLGDLPGGRFHSVARDVSGDGSVAVGFSDSASGEEAFLWTAGGGMVGLGDLAGGAFVSAATAISADGAVVVGASESESGVEAFRWTQAGGMVGLGELAGGEFRAAASATSADGSAVVGFSFSGSGQEAFYWTSTSGIVGLGDLDGGAFRSSANAISADGSMVVGLATSAAGDEAFVWDATRGMRSLAEVLTTDYGLDLTGWRLESATGISADGQRIVGVGTNPNGFTESWLAILPEPSASWLLAIGLLATAAPLRAVSVRPSGPNGSRRDEPS